MFVVLWIVDCTYFLPLLQIWLHIRMRIGLVALLVVARPQVIVYFLTTTFSLGPLSFSRHFLVLVQRQSIVVLPLLLLRLAGYAIYCLSYTPLSSATLVYCDYASAVYLSCNPVLHQRTKHIKIDIHFIRDLVVASQVNVIHVPSRNQFVDIFTKGLPSALFEEFRSNLSVRSSSASTARSVSPYIMLIMSCMIAFHN
nr:ribonuclease H-like domain-containing protein [Tanacetum cinerariifolium]